jgi:hypothetical protein
MSNGSMFVSWRGSDTPAFPHYYYSSAITITANGITMLMTEGDFLDVDYHPTS